MLLLMQCQPKFGLHEVLQYEESMDASEQVYITYLSDQIDRFPEEEDNYVKLAGVYIDQGEYSKAKSVLQKGDRKIPRSTSILVQLAQLYLEQEDVPSVTETLRRLGMVAPENVDYLKISAGFALLQKDYVNAIFYANRAMLSNPYDDENFYLRGRAQLINQDSLSALGSFQEAYQMKSSFRNFAQCFDASLYLKGVRCS